jgi:hypothetical protein
VTVETPDIAGQFRSHLRGADFATWLRWYIEFTTMVERGVVPGSLLAELCKDDRYLLLVGVLNQTHALHPWVYERCREVEGATDGHLDLWARGHYKSTIITFAGSIQEVIRNPEIAIGIFGNDRPVAKGFLRQIKAELELNEKLPRYWPDIFWKSPKKDSPKWSEDEGIVVQRKGNPREATISAWGLVEAQPTGRHFDLRIYDDVVTEDSVTTPDMILKTTERWELSQNLARTEMMGQTGQNRMWHVGTRYHYGDTYGVILKRGALKARIYPATKDGTYDGEPVLLTQAAWDQKKLNESRGTIATQQLLNPIAGELQKFRMEWVQRWETRPERMNVGITVDPANSRTKGACNTAMIVQGVAPGGNWYFLDGYCHQMSLKDRWEALLTLWLKWSRMPGVLLCMVGYEKYGMQADIDYFQLEMDRMPRDRKVSIPITEVNWVSDGSNAKDDRIERLTPLFQKQQYFFPYEGQPTKRMLEQTERNNHHLVAKPIMRKNEQGKLYNVVQYILDNEYMFFPATAHKDGLDAMSRLFDLDITAPAPPMRPEQLIPLHSGEL